MFVYVEISVQIFSEYEAKNNGDMGVGHLWLQWVGLTILFLCTVKSEQHEKQQEIKRRQQGKEMSTFQQQQEEFRNQTWIQERKRQKEEAKKAREEIKAKLEQDRLERRARQRASEAAGKSG